MKKPPGRPSKYPYEFRRMISEKAVSGKYTFRELAQQYGIPHGVINAWKKMYVAGDLEKMNEPTLKKPSSAINKVIALEQENKKLKEELGDLYLQVQMLKKAQVFAQQLVKESSSIITSADLAQYEEDAKS